MGRMGWAFWGDTLTRQWPMAISSWHSPILPIKPIRPMKNPMKIIKNQKNHHPKRKNLRKYFLIPSDIDTFAIAVLTSKIKNNRMMDEDKLFLRQDHGR